MNKEHRVYLTPKPLIAIDQGGNEVFRCDGYFLLTEEEAAWARSKEYIAEVSYEVSALANRNCAKIGLGEFRKYEEAQVAVTS
jgi:hypothetical protein